MNNKQRREKCSRGHVLADVGFYENRQKGGRISRTCKKCKQDRNAGIILPINRSAFRSRVYVLPATDERAIAYRTEAARRGIRLERCA